MRTLLVPAPLRPGPVIIDGDEAHHGRSVLRLAVGDAVRLADGAGLAGAARITSVGRHELVGEVGTVEPVADDPLRLLTIVVAPPKGDRLADLVRGLTELGVGAIRLLACERSERQPANLERLERIAAEAVKQCRRGWMPQLLPAMAFGDLLGLTSHLAVIDQSGMPPTPGSPHASTLLVGPEGGFTPGEFARFDAVPLPRVRLAGPVLRIETAALAAASVWAAAWQTPVPTST